jgi:hypothetical protein
MPPIANTQPIDAISQLVENRDSGAFFPAARKQEIVKPTKQV